MSWSGYDLPHRLAQAGHGLVFYLLKTAWPAGLSPLYEVPRRFQPWEPRFLLCWAAVAALTTLAWRARRSRPQWLASWACYVAVVAPMLGLSQSGRQFTADRYSYLACLPWAALAAGGWLSGAARRPRLRWALSLGAGSLLLALTLAAGRQIAVWRDGLSLWTRAVEIQPESPTSRINLGLALAQAGLPDGAARQFSAALSVNPNCAEQRRASFDAACQAAAAHLEIARKNSRGRSSR